MGEKIEIKSCTPEGEMEDSSSFFFSIFTVSILTWQNNLCVRFICFRKSHNHQHKNNSDKLCFYHNTDKKKTTFLSRPAGQILQHEDTEITRTYLVDFQAHDMLKKWKCESCGYKTDKPVVVSEREREHCAVSDGALREIKYFDQACRSARCVTVKERLCSPDAELLTLSFHPVCLLTKITCYLPCLWHHQCDCCQATNATLRAIKMISGDFNRWMKNIFLVLFTVKMCIIISVHSVYQYYYTLISFTFLYNVYMLYNWENI